MTQINKEAQCRWRRRKEERPAEILAAALKSFTSKGFYSTKLDSIAREAGVSKGTLYLYFDSKEALFKAVVHEFVISKIEAAELQAESYQGDIEDLLYQLVKQWKINVIDTELSGISKIMIAEATNFPDLANFYFENVVKRSRLLIEKLINNGISRGEFRKCDSEYVARYFLTPLIFSAIWHNSIAPYDKSYDVNKYLNTNLEIFLRGIKKDIQE